MLAVLKRVLVLPLLAFVCLAVAGCGTPGKLTEGPPIKSVGIIAAVPETLELTYVGMLSAHDETVNVPWELNQAIATETQRLLQRRYSATVVSTTGKVDNVPELANWFGSTGSMLNDLAKLVKPGEYDAVLVVTGSRGCGVHYSSKFGRQRAFIYLSYRLELFDGRTFKPLASRNLDVANPTLIGGVDNPYRDIDFNYRGQPFASISEGRRQAMRTVALEIIAEGLAFSLPRLGML